VNTAARPARGEWVYDLLVRLPTLAAVVVTLAVAGCGSGATVTVTKTITVTGTVVTRTETTPSGAGSGPVSSAVARCTNAALVVTLRTPPGGAAAGSTYHEIEFRNTGSTTCSLTGFPGVSALSGGKQLGSSARGDGESLPTVDLTPGETAHAQLQIADVDNYPQGRCARSKATDLRVYPPNDFTAQTVAFSFLACAKQGPIYLSVAPVRAGTGISG
jgi:Protein of unknown function (DUF4232)